LLRVIKIQRSRFESLEKGELHELCDRLLACDSDAIDQCIEFFKAETVGLWHGRARAMIARRLKHCRLSQQQNTQLVSVILQRLVAGRFSEQFKDQLRLALHLAPKRTFAAARRCQDAPAAYVRRYAAWILSHETNDRRA
jgi:hypothetical protein